MPPASEPASGLVKAKQGADLHTSSLSQAMAAVYLEGDHLKTQLPFICDFYAPRLNAMLDALEQFFPADWSWSRPEGGMFLWAEGPEGLDTVELNARALERNVAFVPGRYFYADPARGANTMRLNFTNADPGVLTGAIKTLGELVSGS